MYRMITMAVCLYLVGATSTALAQGDLQLSPEELEAQCRGWAAEDQVAEDELEEYVSDCIRLETESYGMEEEVIEVEEDDGDE